VTELHLDDFPSALTAVSTGMLVVAIACAVLVAVDVARRPQPMGVMNVVWPLTMLFGSLLWLWFYLARGRAPRRGDADTRPEHGRWTSVAIGTSHCGAGCALGDLIGEFSLIAFPALGAAVGLGTLYATHTFAAWIVDFVIAFVLGIVFQYCSIAPMRGLGLRAGLLAALKADAPSISSWQVGMYGLMAIAQFAVFRSVFGGTASALTPEFWATMQLAMVAGFLCAYPVNWWLVRSGVKEAM
jgi:hypothetical protein